MASSGVGWEWLLAELGGSGFWWSRVGVASGGVGVASGGVGWD